MYAWLVLLAVVIAFWAWKSTRHPAWCPQGPPLLPVFGNMLSIDFGHPYRTLTRWSQVHGSVYHIRVGAMDQVVISDPALIRDAFSRPELTGRPATEVLRFVGNMAGLATSQGELWRESRRGTLQLLRDLGMGGAALEDYILGQVGGFMAEVLAPGSGAEVSVDAPLSVAVANIIWRLVASEELSITDDRVHRSLGRLTFWLEFSQRLAVLDALPWLERVLPKAVLDKPAVERQVLAAFEDLFAPPIRRHREEPWAGAPRDYIDALLQLQRRRPDLFSDHHVLMCVVDVFVAGSDTTAATLRWALCFLCSRPECQRRLQEELDREVGRERRPALADRPRLPYTEAVLLETQRLADVAPLLLPHRTLAPVTVGGHRLPAGVQVIGNARAVHASARLFPDPHRFRPERFLTPDGQFRPDKNVMPFSVGRRQCLGEGLARTELFLFLTSFLQNFSFRWPDGFEHDLSADPEAVFIRSPKPYKLIPMKR